MPICRLNAGSLALNLSSEDDFYPHALAELLCSAPAPLETASSEPDAEIVFTEAQKLDAAVAVPPDGMVIVDFSSTTEIHTEALAARLSRGERPARIRIAVVDVKMAERDLKVHLSVVFFKILSLLDRLVLHAAAVAYRGSVSIFAGGKGAGKSTTSLYLARAGGTILGEDRVILRKDGARFFVSGCGDRARITAKTEEHFFSAPLNSAPLDVEGTLKKQFSAARFFPTAPYRDYPAARIFFNRVGARFRITDISKSEALLHLLRETGAWHRFVDGADHRRHLSYLRAAVEALPAFRLELSPELGDLEKLAGFLGAPL